MNNSGQVVIRKFLKRDRDSVRRISCETAFLSLPREKIFTDDEILADGLTLFYTDYEPESCFVAEDKGAVIGYIIGSKDLLARNRAENKIFLSIILKALRRGIFFNGINLKFFFQCLKSIFKGEFFAPDFSKEFPSALHINIKDGYRGQGIGERLIKAYLDYLVSNNVSGVHFGTFSEGAKDFFVKMGFSVLLNGRRSYFKVYSGKEINYYVMGRKLRD